MFTDKVEQYVLVELCKSAFTGRTLKKDGDEFLIRTGAGASLPPLVRKAVKEGWFTFGRLTGIPGTVGGAVHGNSGTRLGEIGDFVERVFVLHPDHPEKKLITSPDFTYRSSSLTDEVILEVEFSGTNIEGDNKAPPHERLHEKRSETQPISERSAGCMFKNPDDDSAGRLIDEAGLKGFEVGDARVSSDHANFIVNKGDATSRDVLELIGKVQERVHVEYDVRLEPEVRII